LPEQWAPEQAAWRREGDDECGLLHLGESTSLMMALPMVEYEHYQEEHWRKKKRPNLACTPYLASRLESGLGVSPRLVPFQFFFLFLYANLQYFHSGQWKWGRSSHQAKQNSFTTLFHF
jgi:hypothetical protein